ncbi:MAG: hypothetical protein ACFNOP_05975 [Bacteroides sp.]
MVAGGPAWPATHSDLYTAAKQVSSRESDSLANRLRSEWRQRERRIDARATKLQQQLDSLAHLQDSQAGEHLSLANRHDSLVAAVQTASREAAKSSSAMYGYMRSGWLWGGVIGAVCVVALLILLLLQRRRMGVTANTIAEVKSAQDALGKAQIALQEEGVKLDAKLLEILERQTATLPSVAEGEEDHSLALKVADEVVRIEMNLAHMDPAIKGHKQLLKAVERIRNNFLANGYEMVEMLGKPYTEGMKVTANFVPDDTIPAGAQLITGIIKPQVNYQGRMIQAAQITVSQNI